MISVMIRGTIPFGLTQRALRRAMTSTFVVARRQPSGSVSIAFVSDAEMRRLNRRWRTRDRSTDVLSFAPAQTPGPRSLAAEWGDIIIAPAFIKHECRKQSIQFSDQVLRVLIHGMLHLFGLDHASPGEVARMFPLQERALQRTLKRQI